MQMNADSRLVPYIPRNRRIYEGGGSMAVLIGSGGSTGTGTVPAPATYVLTRAGVLDVWPDPVKVAFTVSSTPTLGNWQRDYAADYGEWPTVQLWYTGAGRPSDVVPVRNEVGGLLDSFVWDIGESVEGYFIIKR